MIKFLIKLCIICGLIYYIYLNMPVNVQKMQVGPNAECVVIHTPIDNAISCYRTDLMI